MGERRGAYSVLVGRPEGRRHLEHSGVEGAIILKWIFEKWDGWGWTGFIWLRIGTGVGLLAGSSECGDEPSGSIKYGEFLDQLRNS
jgi:hypothetical protein